MKRAIQSSQNLRAIQIWVHGDSLCQRLLGPWPRLGLSAMLCLASMPSMLLFPDLTRAQVTIRDTVAIGQPVADVPSFSFRESGAVFGFSWPATGKSGKATIEENECGSNTIPEWIPCKDSPGTVQFGCLCGDQCPAGPYGATMNLTTLPTNELTLTWSDGSIGPPPQSTIDVFATNLPPPDNRPVLLTEAIPWVSNTWWGVGTFDGTIFVQGELFCTGPVEVPVDLDDDLIADVWEQDHGAKSMPPSATTG